MRPCRPRSPPTPEKAPELLVAWRGRRWCRAGNTQGVLRDTPDPPGIKRPLAPLPRRGYAGTARGLPEGSPDNHRCVVAPNVEQVLQGWRLGLERLQGIFD